MKAYVNINSVVVGFGEIDSLFIDCEPIEITEEDKVFIESCKLPKYLNKSFVESFTLADENEKKTKKAIEIDLYYTKKISELLAKPIEKLNCDGIPIPQSKLDERDALRAECNTKILALGITDFTYRKSVPKLAKF